MTRPCAPTACSHILFSSLGVVLEGPQGRGGRLPHLQRAGKVTYVTLFLNKVCWAHLGRKTDILKCQLLKILPDYLPEWERENGTLC